MVMLFILNDERGDPESLFEGVRRETPQGDLLRVWYQPPGRFQGAMSEVTDAVTPTTPFFIGYVTHGIKGKIYFPAIVMTKQGYISLEVFPPRYNPEDEERFMSRLTKELRDFEHPESAKMVIADENLLPAYGNFLGYHSFHIMEAERIIRRAERDLPGAEARYETFLEYCDELKQRGLTWQDLLPNETRSIEEMDETFRKRIDELKNTSEEREFIHRTTEWIKPFPDHYLTVKSERGSVDILVRDPNAFVDIAKSGLETIVEPSGYTPHLVKRRIGIETGGPIKVTYEPILS